MPITQAEPKLPATAPAPAPLDDLEQLAPRIRNAHSAVVTAAGNMILKAMEAGTLLLQAQARVPRNTWMAWLQQNCPAISDRTVRVYIQLAKGREKIEANMKTGLAATANPTLTQALTWLKEPSDPNSGSAGGTGGPKPSDNYDAVEGKLIKKLEEIVSPDTAVAAAQETINKLVDRVRIKTGGKHSLKLPAA
jgi:hypothetical protein